MGYCISQHETKFRVDRRHFPAMYAALNTLAAAAPPGRGYGWVDTPVIRNAKNIVEHLEEWRWFPIFGAEPANTGLVVIRRGDASTKKQVVNFENFDIVDLDFHGEKASGDELALFNAIAPFVDRGSFITMVGEDGEEWRWVFDGAFCKEVHPQVRYDSDFGDVIEGEVTGCDRELSLSGEVKELSKLLSNKGE